jgi:2-iminobutanoate/2-iminopropanoate deaminase
MAKEIILTQQAPAPIGPYNQAVKTGKMIFTAGQIAINPKTNQIDETTIEGQTRQVLLNLKAVLNQAGCDFENVVKSTVFLKDINDFAAMNKVYGEFFTKNPPARSALEVARLPKDAKVEIEAIAALD